jgi:tetratricopeptide (TPR) repeat protein
MHRAGIIGVFAATVWCASKPDECRLLERNGKRAEASACFVALTRSSNAPLRAEGFYGLRRYADAHEHFRAAEAADPKNPEIKVRWGRLLIEPFNKNKKDALDLFQEALELNKKHAGALFGMALVASDGFDSKAVELARQALEADPKLVEAQELLAHLALEDANPAKAREEADKALAISPAALDALAIRAAADILEDKRPDEWLGRIATINSRYGRAHALIAHHLVLNRRYEEGIEHYKKAVEYDPEDWYTHSQLGINLMRLRRNDEAERELKLAFDNGCREASTVNTLNLMASYRNFVTIPSGNVVLKLDKKEADIIRLYFEDELKKAIDTYEKKYRVKLPEPVQLEVYPNHEDFAVRTMGMPGLAALGVTFGTVVAMDSPSGRRPGTFHWASTLWHELSHVFVLTATRHRVPRWFTEGLAVHEETALYPDWGDRLTPDILMAVKDKKLLPVSELDRGFIRPTYPNQVIVSYFQAGRICDYVKEKWSFEKLLEMMQAFGARKSTPEVIQQVLGVKAEEFDKQFLAWLHAGMLKTLDGLDDWKKGMQKLRDLVRQKNHDEVIREGERLISIYPDFVEPGNAYEAVAGAALAKNDAAKARQVLQRYAQTGGRSPESLKKLATLQEEAGDKKGAAATLEKVNFVFPVKDDGLHAKLGDLYLSLGNQARAIREFRAIIAEKPLDKASAYYNLARAYQAAGQSGKAEDSLLEALESAPGFRPAQKMLLELNAKKEKR